MRLVIEALPILLKAGAVGQLLVALLNLRIPHILGWRKDIETLPLLIQEVFHVHVWFISITLTIFAAVTWQFADVMAIDPVARWLACGIAGFWGIRTFIQVFYYSASHWSGKSAEFAVHVTLLIAYGGLAVTYGLAGFYRITP